MSKRLHFVVVIGVLLMAVGLVRLASDAGKSASGASSPSSAAPRSDGYVHTAPATARLNTAPSSYRGLVVGADEEPVSGALVVARPLHALPEIATRSDEHGEFSFDALPRGRYLVSASDGPRQSAPLLVEAEDDYAASVLILRDPSEVQVEVLDARSERPLQGARVRLSGDEETTWSSDEHGTCALGALKPGRHSLAIEADGYASATRHFTLRVGAGAGEQLRVRLVPAAGVEGTVYDEGGAPLAGACVRARLAAAIDLPLPTGSCELGSSDGKGHFVLRGLAAGAYTLTATRRGYAPARASVTLEAGRVERGVALHMAAGAGVTGVVHSARGEPAPGARVTLTRRSSGYAQEPLHDAVCGRDGRFGFADLSEGEYVLEASGEGESAPARALKIVGGAPQEVALRLSQAGAIQGRVIDPRGAGIEGAELHARRRGEYDGRQHQAQSDGDGRFKLAGLAPGRYEIWASWPGSRASDDAARAIVETGAEATLTLRALGALRGVAVGEGAIVESGVDVLVDGRLLTQSNGAGEFQVEGLPAGRHDVTLRGDQFEPATREGVEVRPGAEADLGIVRLRSGAKISGRTLDARGRPVAGAEIVVARFLAGDATSIAGQGTRESTSFKRTESDGLGRFTLSGLAERGLVAAAEHPLWGRSRPVSIAQAGSGELILTLRGGSALRGDVRVAGRPAEGVLVMLSPPTTSGALEGTATLAATTDAAGKYVIERIPAGKYQATAMIGRAETGMRSQRRDVALSEQQTATLDFDLPGGGVVLSLVPPEASSYSATASLSGAAGVHSGQVRSQLPLRLEGVMPGVYLLCVQRHGGASSQPSSAPCRQVRVDAAPFQILRLWS